MIGTNVSGSGSWPKASSRGPASAVAVRRRRTRAVAETWTAHDGPAVASRRSQRRRHAAGTLFRPRLRARGVATLAPFGRASVVAGGCRNAGAAAGRLRGLVRQQLAGGRDRRRVARDPTHAPGGHAGRA